MDFKEFQRFEFLFKCFGFEPLKKFTNLWLLAHLVFATLQLILIFIYRDEVLYTYDVIGKTTDSIKFFWTFLCYFTAIFLTWWSGKFCRLISRHAKHLDGLMDLMHLSSSNLHDSSMRIFKTKFALLALVKLFGMTQEVFFKYDEGQTMRFLLAFTFPYIFSYMKHLHGIFYIDLLNKYIFALNNHLEQLQGLIKCNENKLQDENYSKFLVKKLKMCRNFYATLCSFNELNQRIMGLFIFIFQVNLHIYILSSLYWTTFRAYNQSITVPMCMASATSVFLKCLALFLIADSGEETDKQWKFTAHKLHQIINSTRFKSAGMDNLVESFSLEILTKPINVSAADCFVINLGSFAKLLTSVTFAVSLFIQFSPKYENRYRFD